MLRHMQTYMEYSFAGFFHINISKAKVLIGLAPAIKAG